MSCPFSKYKNIFGVPNKGIHKYKILDTAIVDYVGTIFLAMALTKLTKIPLVISTIIMFVVGILFHYLFGVQTGATNFLGLKC